MAPIEIRWDTAQVSPEKPGYDLEVAFGEQAPAKWWDAFGSALEELSREVPTGRWSSIGKLGEPARGLMVTGVNEGFAQELRDFLDAAIGKANERFESSREDPPEEHTESEHGAAQLAEALRAGGSA